MSALTRFGVSLDSALLAPFDALCTRRGYSNRSEALRDLIRKSLVEDAWETASHGTGNTGDTEDTSGTRNMEGTGTLTLVYDHHKSDLARKLMAIQHEEHDCIVATLHVHLDHHHCLEVLVLKGDAVRVRNLAERLIATRGVKHGALTCTTTGEGLA